MEEYFGIKQKMILESFIHIPPICIFTNMWNNALFQS